MKYYKFCKVADTPDAFDIEKFKSGDIEQVKLYKDSKTAYRKTPVKYEDILKEDSPNFAREVPEGCIFIDFDDPKEADEMYEIITRAKSNCLILETTKGYHFLYRKPNFYEKELTGATNWFGYKFDCKGWTKGKSPPVQIIKVCGMLRKEVRSWDLDTPTTTLDKIDIEELDVLPYWLWGKFKDSELHKGGKTGDRTKDDAVEYTLTDNPFTQLMKMSEGRHNHIVERCSYFGLSNGFEIGEFKDLITAIHDQYLVKIGIPMPDSDLFGDLEERWADYEETLTSSGWEFKDKDRKWEKAMKTKTGKITEQQACEFLYNKYDFYVMGNTYDTGEGGQLCYIDSTLKMVFDLNTMWKEIRNTFCDYSFKTIFYEEVKKQLIQRCNENKKIFRRNSNFYVCKNGIASCISDDIYDFDYFKEENLPPTDLVYDWTLHNRTWVEEHKDDLGRVINNFLAELSRDYLGVVQEEIIKWFYVIYGAIMCHRNQLCLIVILSGGGRNGKSIFIALAKMLLGRNLYNESNIFGTSPTTGYWGQDLDKGICCLIDELPPDYNKEAFSYIKGGITGTASVEINPKYGKKKSLETLPQIVCATNSQFKLFDNSEGMRRRVAILPCSYKVQDEELDNLLLYRMVMNLDNSKKSDEQIMEYRKSEMSADAGIIIEKSGIRIRDKCVLDSLDHGSLCWVANKARYMYLDFLSGKITLKNTEEMEHLFENIFDDNPKGQCEDFMNWHLLNKCGSTDGKKVDLSPANGFYSELYLIYKNEYCIAKKITPMEYDQFKSNFGKVARKHFTVKKERNDKGMSYLYVFFDKPAKPSKKKYQR